MANKPQGISKITVKGFKSLYDETSVEIRPLTILAGANSSGKSSIMQPLLLMKQTLESTYTPKVFLLNGPNVRYTDPRQFFHIDSPDSELEVSLEVDYIGEMSSTYSNQNELHIESTSFNFYEGYEFLSSSGQIIDKVSLFRNMPPEQIANQMPPEMDALKQTMENFRTKRTNNEHVTYYSTGDFRCFLDIELRYEDDTLAMVSEPSAWSFFPILSYSGFIQDIIHVPGLRDNPRRNYPKAEIEGSFTGTFDDYFASVMAGSLEIFDKTSIDLKRLELTPSGNLSVIFGIDHIELRLPHKRDGEHHINIADVGLGVSQVLPVLVALLVAKEGQLVYLEQPELHLHPRAQVKLAQIIADASNRGVRVVVETHSSLLLIGIQTLIAEEKLQPEDTILHWFTREDGKTTVDSQIPDVNGVFGETPEDFGEVELSAQNAYITAVEERMFGQPE